MITFAIPIAVNVQVIAMISQIQKAPSLIPIVQP